MEHAINTLQEFMTFTKGWTYIFMGLTLVCTIGFWRFLNEMDSEERKKTF